MRPGRANSRPETEALPASGEPIPPPDVPPFTEDHGPGAARALVVVLVHRLPGLRVRVRDVGREQLEAAVLAAVGEAPDAVVAERPALVGDFPVVLRVACGGRRSGVGGRL